MLLLSGAHSVHAWHVCPLAQYSAVPHWVCFLQACAGPSVVPGPSAVVAAVVAGFSVVSEAHFLGHLPLKLIALVHIWHGRHPAMAGSTAQNWLVSHSWCFPHGTVSFGLVVVVVGAVGPTAVVVAPVPSCVVVAGGAVAPLHLLGHLLLIETVDWHR